MNGYGGFNWENVSVGKVSGAASAIMTSQKMSHTILQPNEPVECFDLYSLYGGYYSGKLLKPVPCRIKSSGLLKEQDRRSVAGV